MKRFLELLLLAITLMQIHCVKQPEALITEHTPQKATEITAASFDSYVKTSPVSVIEFYSGHCMTCASMVWIIDSLHDRFSAKAFIGANNIDGDDQLWQDFPGLTVPSYLFFRNGQEVTRRSFSENKPGIYDTLAAIIQQVIDNVSPPDTLQDTVPPVDTVPTDYVTLTTATFDSAVLRNDVVAMVFFLYQFGSPCIRMDSIVQTLIPRFTERALIAKVHAWDESTLSDRYGITMVPQFVFFKNGIEDSASRIIGTASGDSLAAVLERLLTNDPPEKTVSLTKDNFAAQLGSKPVTMVEFFSPTCGGCIYMKPFVEAVADTFEGTSALIAKVDITVEDSLKQAFNITAWPTFIFFCNSQEYLRMRGGTEIDTLVAAVRLGFENAFTE